MVDIFDEVEEELRAERAEKLLKKHAGLIIAVAVLIVALVGAWQGWRWWQDRQDMAAAGRYLTAMATADNAGSDNAKQQAAAAEFAGLAGNAPEGYATLARLRLAALKAQSGDMKDAAALWEQVARDGAAEPLLRDLASLLWAQHQIDTGDPGILQARLKALAMPDNAWHALAREQLALLDLRQGHTDSAKAGLRKLSQDVTATDGVRGRAAALLAQLGG